MAHRQGSAASFADEHFWDFAGSSASHLFLHEKDVLHTGSSASTMTLDANGDPYKRVFTSVPAKGTKIANGGFLMTNQLNVGANVKDTVTVTLFGVNTGSVATKADQVKLSVSRNDGKTFVTGKTTAVGRWGPKQGVAFVAKMDFSGVLAGSKIRVKVELFSQEFEKSALGLVGINVEF